MKNQPSLEITIAFDALASNEEPGEQELALVRQFLPELLKELIWQTSEQEN